MTCGSPRAQYRSTLRWSLDQSPTRVANWSALLRRTAWGTVAVRVEGEGDRRVAELFLDHLRVDAGLERWRGHRVAGVVRRNFGTPARLTASSSIFVKRRVVCDTGLVDQHVATVGPRPAGRQPVLALAPAATLARGHGHRGEQ